MRLAGFFLSLLLSLYFPSSFALETGSDAPDWVLPKSDTHSISYYLDSDGQHSVLVFWATWCPYCKDLLPQLEELRKKYANQPVTFYALNIWEDGDPMSYMKQHSLELSLVLRADDVAKRYGVKGTPGLFLVDPSHKIKYIRNTGTPNDKLVQQVASWLETELTDTNPTLKH